MEKPFNCLWLIDPKGEIRERYDKRFLTGNFDEEEHYHYSAGMERVIFELGGISCGLLICHEWRYPELYRDYKKAGVQLIFQSWYDGGLSPSDYTNEGEELGSLITGYVRGNAANNYLWISASNTCRPESSFPAFVARPDGRIINKLKRNITGLMISEIHPDQDFTDPSGPWRDRAYEGIFHSA
jgi:predicted amidohydrolase